MRSLALADPAAAQVSAPRLGPGLALSKTSSNIFYLVATSMISAVPAKTHFAGGAFVLRGAEKT